MMIGPRSALFTPFTNLGLIIMDEEHEGAYKSETGAALPCAGNGSPHCQNVRRRCGIRLGDTVRRGILPGKEKRIHACYELPRRASGTLPAVYTVDLREELKCGNRSVFSRRLQELIQRRLAAKEQIILFLNKRGYAGFVSCRMLRTCFKMPALRCFPYRA